MKPEMQLAVLFYNYLKRPISTVNNLEGYARNFKSLMPAYSSDDLNTALKWAFVDSHWWSVPFLRADKPFSYFKQKLGELLKQHNLATERVKNAQLQQEGTTNASYQNRPRNSRDRTLNNEANGEQAVRELLVELGISE